MLSLGKDILLSFRTVFSRPSYILLTVLSGALLLVLAIWLPNLHLVSSNLLRKGVSLEERAGYLVGSLGAFRTNFSALSRWLVAATSLLFGINLSMVVFYIKRRVKTGREAGLSVSGLLLGFLGIGCVACGSVILSALFGFGFTAGTIGLLPLRGLEMGILSVLFLSLSIVLSARKINDSDLCRV